MSIAEKIIEIATKTAEEEKKALNGNYSAGTRARAGFQEIKKLCQEGRQAIQASRASAGESTEHAA